MKKPSTTKGHHHMANFKFCHYDVYDNRTDVPIIIDGTAEECASAMEMKLSSFYRAVCYRDDGRKKRRVIVRRWLDEEEKNEN